MEIIIHFWLEAATIDPARDSANDSCVTAQIEKSTTVVKDSGADPTAKQEALKYVIHFVGGVHQPLRCEGNHDLGGNQKTVRFFGRRPKASTEFGTTRALRRIWAKKEKSVAGTPGYALEEP